MLNVRWIGMLLLTAMLLSGCSFVVQASASADDNPESLAELAETVLEEVDEQPGIEEERLEQDPAVEQAEVQDEVVAEPEQLPEEGPFLIGPESYPEGVNPLTGLSVSDPAVLDSCPLLVAVSNFPPSARGVQSGLSVADQVWETFIGEGMTRYLAVFYGDYVKDLQAILANPSVEAENFVIGPVRSGRVAFEDIKVLFPGATLITAGASAEVAEQLTGRVSVYGADPDDINSAGVEAGDLSGIPCRHGKPASFSGLAFNPQPPSGGSQAHSFRLVYNLYNQIGWEFAPEVNAYLRSQDKADGTGELYPSLENLTGEQLGYENVLVLFAKHTYVTPTILEINLMYLKNHRGILFRDGQWYWVRWSTLGGKLALEDESGNTLALNPGRTFFEVVSYQTTWNPDSMIFRYHNP